jgi:transcriptional regulator with XRE-family HTH domain
MPPKRRGSVGSVHSERYRVFLSRLKQARVEAGMTQVMVATALRRPQSYVAKCESGERRVDVVELEDFARLYRRAVQFFLPTKTVRSATERPNRA